MNAIEHLLESVEAIETKLNYHFKDKFLLATAFVHRSFINENRDVIQHNERLEFLGDAILGALMAEYLFVKMPDAPEGDLSYLRSRLVEASSCMTFVQKLDVSKYLLLGKGERMNDGRGRESILADFFEALVGAIYLDGGLESVRVFLFKNFAVEIEKILATPLRNWKADLQEYAQSKFQVPPIYQVLEEVGPDHSKTFKIAVLINGNEMGRGQGSSKKEAQQAAAQDALLHLNFSNQ